MNKLTIIVLILGVLVLGTYVFMRSSLRMKHPRPVPKAKVRQETELDLRPLVVAKLQQLIKAASNGLYNFSADSVRLDVLNSTAELFDVTLSPDSAARKQLAVKRGLPDDVYRVRVKSLKITGINIDDLLHRDRLDIGRISIQAPVVDVYHQKQEYNAAEQTAPSVKYQQLIGQMKHLGIADIALMGGTINVHNLSKAGKATHFNEVSVKISKLLIDSASNDRVHFPKVETAVFSFRNYTDQTNDGLYTFSIGSGTADAVHHRLLAKDVHLTPNGGRQGFRSKLHFRKEMYTLTIGSASMENVSWWALANSEELTASDVTVSNARFDVFSDLSLPSSGRADLRNFPDQKLMKIGLPVRVKHAHLKNISVSYEEYNPGIHKTGKVFFTQLDGEGSNITNIPAAIRENAISTVRANAQFLGQIPSRANLVFDLSKVRSGSFKVDFHMDKMDGSVLNPVAETMGYFSVKRGSMESGEAHLQGNNGSAKGTVLLLYNDLHITPLKKDPARPGELKKKSMTSLLANKLFIKDNNPANGQTRTSDCALTRDPKGGSFFNFVWQTMMIGIFKTIGVPARLAK